METNKLIRMKHAKLNLSLSYENKEILTRNFDYITGIHPKEISHHTK